MLKKAVAIVILLCSSTGLSLQFFKPIRHSDSKAVKQLIDQDADVNEWLNPKDTPLHLAVREGDVDIVKMLIAAGADVNAQAPMDKVRPIHDAVRTGNVTIVILLCDAGAQLDVCDNRGNTPLHIAARLGDMLMIQELTKRGGDLTIKNNEGKTPYTVARTRGHGDCAQLLEPSIFTKRKKLHKKRALTK